MIRNSLRLLLLFFSASAFALSYPYIPAANVIDTVVVPVKCLKLVGMANNVFDYAGKVTYDLRTGVNDSLAIALDFVPVAGGAAVTPYEVTGAAGVKGFLETNGFNGTNEISFRCRITGQPAGMYYARITITAVPSAIEKSVDSLLALMSDAEKVGQLAGSGQLGGDGGRDSPDNTRLGIPGYHMSNGPQQPCYGAGGNATAFPCPPAMANTFDTALIFNTGVAIAKEYWAKGKYILEGPVVSMIKDPRCGRGWETFSEDPFLSAMISAAYVKGVQSTRIVTTVKHFICNEVETARNTSSSNVSERTLREVYAMPFEYCIKDAKAYAIMVAYNKVNNTYCTQNAHILTDILKYDWGFKGYALSDWGAMHSTAAAANAGHDVELVNNTYFGSALVSAVATGAVSKERLNDMARRMLRNKVFSNVLGKLSGQSRVQFASELMGAAHKAVCLEGGRKSIVLAKNENNTLPLDKNTLTSIAVVGPYANTARLSGGGSGAAACALPSNLVSPVAGITAKVGASKVTSNWQNAEVVVVVIGVSGESEGSDRPSLGISGTPDGNALVTQVLAANKKCIAVLTGGTAASKDAWANAQAILVAWYPGENQGTALADIIFGDVNPSGKLAASWPVSAGTLPPWNPSLSQIPYDSPDTGFGYRWNDRTGVAPFLPFGHGLSYTTFAYSSIRLSANPVAAGEDVVVTVNIKNTGTRAGDEVAQLYLSETAPLKKRPVKELRGFARVTLAAGEAKDVSFRLRPRELAYFDDSPAINRFVVQPDEYTIKVGPSSAVLPLSATLTVQ